jgi:tetrapyrrole methylase family protein / MazG family protein
VKRKSLEDLKKVVKTLRGPKGCPWDKKQTAKSLTPYAVEEALELEEAIHHKSQQDIVDELGDVLFQVVLQSQIASEKNKFTLDDVIDSLCQKMVRRHPHVFKSTSRKMSANDVKDKWEKDKNLEKNEKTTFLVPKNFPALLVATKIGKKSRSINFDWDKAEEIFTHFLSEVDELKEAIQNKDPENQWEEVGDALFTLAQVARHLSVDPEKALRLANKKVVDRILAAHKLSKLPWKEFGQMSLDDKELLWQEVKKQNKEKLARRKKKK